MDGFLLFLSAAVEFVSVGSMGEENENMFQVTDFHTLPLP